MSVSLEKARELLVKTAKSGEITEIREYYVNTPKKEITTLVFRFEKVI